MRSDENIIRYLSGEMNRQEAETFEQLLAEKKELQKEFENQSLAWKLIETQMRQRDEEHFRKGLKEIMDAPEEKKRKLSGRWEWIFLPVAAAVALLVVFLTMDGGTNDLFRQNYRPADDPLLVSLLQETRGRDSEMAMLYREERFEACLEEGLDLLQEGSKEMQILLFTLLSALETDRETEILPLLDQLEAEYAHPRGQVLGWYHALALFKAGNIPHALEILEDLSETGGPYGKAAHKLARRLKK